MPKQESQPEPTEQSNTDEGNVVDATYEVARKLQQKVGQSLTAEEAGRLVSEIEKRAESVRELPLTPENWTAEFGEDSKVKTPLGEVKMGENQIEKLFEKR